MHVFIDGHLVAVGHHNLYCSAFYTSFRRNIRVRINTQKMAKDDEIWRKTVKTHERRLKTVENRRKTPKEAKIRLMSQEREKVGTTAPAFRRLCIESWCWNEKRCWTVKVLTSNILQLIGDSDTVIPTLLPVPVAIFCRTLLAKIRCCRRSAQWINGER